MRNILPGCLLILCLCPAGCRRGPERVPAIGEAFAGPAELKIRKDMPPDAPVVAMVKHGERLEILQRRRRLVRVRARGGAEGWTDERLLLRASDMAALRNLMAAAAKLPSQGKATTYSDLNIHTQPFRQAPSFLQMKEGEKVDVLLSRSLPRTDMPRQPLLPPPPKKAAQPKKVKRAKEPRYPPPPGPKPPPLPANWQELSVNPLREEPAEQAREKAPEEAPAPPRIPTDDWSLVRTASGQAGWALTRRLVMSIPDEVAQYAEGRRITSYFALGSVRDGEQTRHHWLWTTVGSGAEGYDFDSFRVFVWSLRRHRYETAYIERNLKGYAPVLIEAVNLSAKGRGAAGGVAPGFSVCVEKRDGQRVRRSFAFLDPSVRAAGERPCDAASPIPVDLAAVPAGADASPRETPASPSETLWQRFKQRVRDTFRRGGA